MPTKRRRKVRPLRMAMVIAVPVLLVIGLIFGVRALLSPKKEDTADQPEETTEEKDKQEETKEEEKKEQKVTVFLTGDGLIHESVYMDAWNEDGSFNFDKQLHRIAEIAEPYDLQYYNQETILGGTELGLSGYPVFNSPKEFGQYMVDSGFNLVSTANNHCLDMGFAGVSNSREFWNSQKNVLMQGTNTSQEEYDAIASMEVNGIKIAFVSYCEHTNGIYPEYDYEVNYFPGYEEAVLDKIRRAKETNDVVIAAMHWGTEYSHGVNETQTWLAQEMVKAGADIIVGNHPHVIQPFQWIDGKPVFYAMGNLISSQLDNDNLIGMMAGLDITKTEENGETVIKIDHVRADLHYTIMEGVYPDLRYNIEVIPFSQLNDEILPGYQEIYKTYTDIIKSLDSNIEIGGL